MKKRNSITGLLLYSYHATRGTTLLILAVWILHGFIMLVTGDARIFPNLTGFGIVTISCSFMLCAHKDNSTQWNKCQLAMPIKRSDVITSKFLSQLFLMLVAITLIATFVGLSMVFHESIKEVVRNTSLIVTSSSIGISLVACALFYPIIYTIGENKEEVIIIFCILGGAAINLFILVMGETLNFSNITSAALCIIISVALFGISYVITKKIYAKKDL
ncbi:MAG: ABC-2 transporter permease [Ruminococcus sp.]|nr:ABC-2 transporter permease [Ruminococcus sp.]